MAASSRSTAPSAAAATRLVAERIGPAGTLIGIDRDPLAEERFAELAAEVTCPTRFIRAGFAEALELLAEEGLRADVAYFDLGMSSMQVDTRERGFSYSYDAPLDMRMDPDQELSAREIVNDWDERRLARVLRDFGEERHAGAIARAIVRRRAQAPIETTLELVDTINSAIPAPARFGGGHPAKRVFQALRIAVNDELEQLDRALPLAWGLLREGGVLAGISFHSLEDRRVKRFLAERARAASARPTCRCAAAAACPKARCSPAAPWRPRPARSPPTRARSRPTCAPRASSRSRASGVTAAGAAAARSPAARARARAAPDAWAPARLGGPGARRRRVAPRRAPFRSVSACSPGRCGAATARSSRLLDRLIRGRAWIVLIGFALLGIVAMQVSLLKLNAGIGRAARARGAAAARERGAAPLGLAAGRRASAGSAKHGHGHCPSPAACTS